MLDIVKQACDIVGGPNRLAELLGCRRQALYQWDEVPRGRAIEIEEATDGQIPRHRVRPDLFPPPGAAAESSTGPCTITMDQLEPETLAALRERARMSGRSLETEIKVILDHAARAGRSELATWSAGLRSRLRNRYVGDVTADIRSDRQR